MANSIALVTKYIPYLDQVYAYASRTAVLDAPADLVKQTADAKTVMIAKTSMDGLADYDRNNGFADGAASLEWESKTLEHDRGRSFSIDAMDDLETLGIAFGTLASEFIRTKVVPEVDALRFSKYAAGGHTEADGALTAANIVEKIDAGIAYMKEAEVDLTGAYLFITPTLFNAIKSSDKFTRPLAPGQNPNRNFGTYDELTVIEVPQKRFYTGVTEGENGFTTSGSKINFQIIAPSAVLQVAKHAKLRVFDPDVNQKADAYKIDYRIYHDAWTLENKTDGIYTSTANA